MRRYFIVFVSLLFSVGLFSATSPHGFEMGAKPESIAGVMKDVSNKESWEEKSFLMEEPVSIFGMASSQTELGFWNKRLYQVKFTLPFESWAAVAENLDKLYGKAWTADTAGAEKSGSWGDARNGVSVFQLSSSGTILIFTDEEQKAFRFSDLFQGMLLYIIVTIVGLFVLNYLIGWLLTGYCKRCKSFGMKYQEVSLANLKDHSSEILTTSMQHDVVYLYKCTKCGHTRKDKYSGFWSYMRSRE